MIIKIHNEICLHIFDYLSPRDLCKISLVCRSFKKLADDDQIWKSKCPSKLIISKNKIFLLNIGSIISSRSKQYKQIYIKWREELTCQQDRLFQRKRTRAITMVKEYRPFQTQKYGCMRMYRTVYDDCSSRFCHNGCMNHLFVGL